MTRDEYTTAVQKVLAAHTPGAVQNLEATLARIPAKAKRVIIEIFLDQGGEGFLSVRIGLDGPDLVVLIKAIEQTANLFPTKTNDGKLLPKLPLMGRDESFSVNDALSDAAARWLETLWSSANRKSLSIPAVIETHDGYGTITPINLN